MNKASGLGLGEVAEPESRDRRIVVDVSRCAQRTQLANEKQNSDRRLPRVELNLFLWYRLLGDLQGSEKSHEEGIVEPVEGLARLVDLSKEGVGFVSSKALPTGACVFLEITSPRGNLSAVGRIRNCVETGEQYRIGILFEVIPPNDRSVLAVILKS